MVKRLDEVPPLLQGPMGVTPVGIAFAAMEAPGFRVLTIYLDDKVVTLEDWGSTKLVDALLAGGHELAEFAPKPTKMVTIAINGEARQFPGAPGATTRILLDGQVATPDAALHDGARIQIVKPQPGSDESPLKVSDIVDLSPVPVVINGLAMDFPPLIKVNGASIMGDRHLHEGDGVTIDRSVRALMVQAGISEAPLSVLRFWIDGEPREYPLRQLQIKVNGQSAALATEIKGHETVEVSQQLFPHPTVGDVLPPGAGLLSLKLNDKSLTVPNPAIEFLMGGEPVALDTPVTEGAQIRRQLGKRMTVADILPMIQDELEGHEGDEILVTVDGKFADMGTAIAADSLIEVLTDEEEGPADEEHEASETQA
jgi:hypothetical protein